MVNIDTVYQRVLTICNKEQRGYVTPLEFNLLANQAQMEIFEQYFYDVNQNERQPGNSRQYSDIEHIMNEKIAPFEVSAAAQGSEIMNGTILPVDLYMLGQVVFEDEKGIERECEEITSDEFTRIRNSKILGPTTARPVFIRYNSSAASGYDVSVYGKDSTQITNNLFCNYVRIPRKVEWGYDVVGEKALHNGSANRTFHFEHHRSEETVLVVKILELAGVVIEADKVTQYANAKFQQNLQQEKQ